MLPSEDVEQYQRHVSRFFAEYDPATDDERDLVQCIADTAWRLLRIPALESALFALARIQFKDMFQDEPAELRASLIEAQALVAFQKQFNNLGIQEARLLRRMTKTRAELTDLQSRRRAAKPKPAAPNGFEFSSAPNTEPQKLTAQEFLPPNLTSNVAHGFSVPERASARRLGGRA